MYKGKFAAELSMNEVKEYYDELRQKYPLTEEQLADFNILKEKLIAFAYKILKQEPCDDCVSRKDAIIQLSHNKTGDDDCDVIIQSDIETIKALPPVTPKQIGRWINGNPICPCCGEDKYKDLDADIWSDWRPKYCPNCGAKMESEVKG